MILDALRECKDCIGITSETFNLGLIGQNKVCQEVTSNKVSLYPPVAIIEKKGTDRESGVHWIDYSSSICQSSGIRDWSLMVNHL